MRNGRPEVQTFAAEESLFRRCDPDHVAPDGTVMAEAFRFPELSVLRSGGQAVGDVFEPEDALWLPAEAVPEGCTAYLLNCCVVRFSVQDVPTEIQRPDAAPYTTSLIYSPFDDLYPHSEVHVLQNGVVLRHHESAIKRPARRELREKLARASVLVYPQPAQ